MMAYRNAPDEGPSSQLSEVARHAGHGLTLAAAVFVFFLAGWWLDGHVGTRPLFAIVGAMLGAMGGFYSLYQNLVLKPEARRAKEAERDRDSAGPDSRGSGSPGER